MKRRLRDHSRTACLLLLLVLSFTPKALSWNESGHRLMAVMAYDLLSDAARQQVLAQLKTHPRYEQDFVRTQPGDFERWTSRDQQRWLFSQAAVWPDLARSFIESQRNHYHRMWWHFINMPLYPDEQTQRQIATRIDANVETVRGDRDPQYYNILQALDYASDDNNRQLSDGLKWCWLFHLIGDLHQPLHASSMFAGGALINGDRGGNLIIFKDRSLHSWWDAAAGRELNFGKLLQRSEQLLRVIAEPEAELNSAPATWLNESHQLAKQYVYTNSIRQAFLKRAAHTQRLTVVLDQSYLDDMQHIGRQQIVASAYRLAARIETQQFRPD